MTGEEGRKLYEEKEGEGFETIKDRRNRSAAIRHNPKGEPVQYLTDSEGNKKGVVLDWQTWEGILALAEESAPLKEIVQGGEEAVISGEESLTLDELLAGVTEENLHREISTGESVGGEVW